MFSFKRSFTRGKIAAFTLFAASQVHAGLGVPSICKVTPYEPMTPDITITLTTNAWAKGDPTQCSFADANQIVNDGKNNGYNADPNLRTNACPEITIQHDDVVLIDAQGRTFAVTSELFFSNKNIVVVRNGVFKGSGGTRILRVTYDAQLVLEKDEFSDGESPFGGAILVEDGGYLTVHESRFEQNYSELDGAAIACQSCNLLDLQKTFFAKNHADRNGGALFISGAEFAYIHESRIRDNSAGSGGGIYADGLADIDIKASYIEDNHAIGGDGGGVFTGALLSASCTKFSGNEAESGNGGAIYQQAASALTFIESSYFISNKTGMDIRGLGGAIFAADDFTLRTSSVVGNEARRGGAVYVHPSAADDPLIFENNTIAENNALIEGGAFWITGDNAIVRLDDGEHNAESLLGGEFSFRMLHNTIYDNTAENGQIFIYDAGVDASNEILFLNNIIDQPANKTINCQGNVGRLLTHRPNDPSTQKNNTQWPGQSCGQDMLSAHASGTVEFGGLFNQGYAQTIIANPGDIIACANVRYHDQFTRMSKCRPGAVRRGPPVAVDDPEAPL